MARPSAGFWLPILAFFVCLATIGAICTITFRTVILRDDGTFSGKERVVYATGTTILASCITAFVLTQTRRLFIRYVDGNIILSNGEMIHAVSGKWRTILGVASVAEMWESYRIVLTYGGIALITASIVASFTPTQGSKTVPHTVRISSGEPYSGDMYCANIYPSERTFGYYWNMTDGNQFWVNVGGVNCPTSRMIGLIQNINGLTPKEYAYTDFGVAVHSSAAGTPVSVYSWPPGYDRSLRRLVTNFGPNLVKTSQCVPIMVRNPVSCKAEGRLSVTETNMTVTATDGSCLAFNAPIFGDPRTTDSMANSLCASGSVGEATVMFSATGRFAAHLALDMGDTETFPWYEDVNMKDGDNDARYAVTCKVDTRDVYEFRKVTLSLQSSSDIALQWFLSGERSDDCDNVASYYPSNFTGQAAITSLSSMQAIYEYRSTGWYGSIHRSSYDDSNPNVPAPRREFAFPDSKNGLEDVLGVTAAMVGAYMNSTRIDIPAWAVVTNTRVGNGNALTLIYTIPPLFAAIMLGWLLWRTALLPHVEISTIDLERLVSFQYSIVGGGGSRPISKAWSNYGASPPPVYEPLRHQ